MGGALPKTTVVEWRKHPEMVAFMSSYIPGHTEAEIRAAFMDAYGICLTESQIANFKTRYGIRSGTNGGRFEKGHESWNKGRPQAEWMGADAIKRTKATRFKKGQLPHNTRAIGDERVTKDGYIEVHVGQHRRSRANDQWVLKQRLVWERENGRSLKRDEVVLFADGDKRNFDPGNLVAVTMAENIELNRINRPYSDRDTLMSALAVVKLNQTISSAEKRERRCVSCGAPFMPRFKNQKRCDRCISAGRNDLNG